MNRRIAVRAIVVLDGKLLCAQAKPYSPTIVTGRWGVPGGGIDGDEALIPALQREIFEELGIKPDVGNLLYVQQYKKDSGGEELEFFFHIKNAEDYLDIDLSKTSHGHVEIERVEFIDASTNEILPKFLTTESFTNISDQSTKIFNYL